MKYFHTADILLPKGQDWTKWSVVACDQYTSEPEYWKRTEELVGEAPSALHLIFPEIYLQETGDRITTINNTMRNYLREGVFEVLPDAMIYVERSVGQNRVRHGLIGTVDLELYDYQKGTVSPIRATEGTVLERIPPRVRIRENAPIELPHIMLLIDDPEKTVIEPIAEAPGKKIYDFDLMQNSGHIVGYLPEKAEQERVREAISRLAEPEQFEKRYQTPEKPLLLFAVGDGNHSLATAKACWEAKKKTLSQKERENHPARFALVELVNLHDEALEFEPIHRVVFGVEPKSLLEQLRAYYPDVSGEDNGGQHISCTYGGERRELYIKGSNSNLPVGTLQNFLDAYLAEHGGTIDYIHGAEVVERLSREDDCIGFYLPAMQKTELFRTVLLDGALPRKTFSMGEAWEKRFYLEAKKLG